MMLLRSLVAVAVLLAVAAPTALARIGFEFETNMYVHMGKKTFSHAKYTKVKVFDKWAVELDVVKNSFRVPTKNDVELVTAPLAVHTMAEACDVLKEVRAYVNGVMQTSNEQAHTNQAAKFRLPMVTEFEFEPTSSPVMEISPQVTVGLPAAHLHHFFHIYFESRLDSMQENLFSRKVKKVVQAVTQMATEDAEAPKAYWGLVDVLAEYVAAGAEDSNYPKESMFFLARTNVAEFVGAVRRIIGTAPAAKYLKLDRLKADVLRAAKHAWGCVALDGTATPTGQLPTKCAYFSQNRLFSHGVRFGPITFWGPKRDTWLTQLLAGTDECVGTKWGSMGAMGVDKLHGEDDSTKSGIIFEIRGLPQTRHARGEQPGHAVDAVAFKLLAVVHDFVKAPEAMTALKINTILDTKTLDTCPHHKRKKAMTDKELGPLLSKEVVAPEVQQRVQEEVERYFDSGLGKLDEKKLPKEAVVTEQWKGDDTTTTTKKKKQEE